MRHTEEVSKALLIADEVFRKEFEELKTEMAKLFEKHNLVPIYFVLEALKDHAKSLLIGMKQDLVWDEKDTKKLKRMYG